MAVRKPSADEFVYEQDKKLYRDRRDGAVRNGIRQVPTTVRESPVYKHC